MHGGDGSLQGVGPRSGRRERFLHPALSLGDGVAIPAGAILVLQEDQIALGVGAGQAPGVVQQHQGEQTVGLRLVGQQLYQLSR